MITILLAVLATWDEPKVPAKPAQGEQSAKLTADELKKLKANNIFAPATKVKPPEKTTEKPPKKIEEPAKPAPKMLSVTGFFKDEVDKCYKVIIEDRTWKETKYVFTGLQMLKAGEEVAGGKVVEVRLDSFDHQVGEKKSTLKAGDQVELPGSVSTGATKPTEGTTTTPSTEPKPTDTKTMEEKLRELRDKHKGKKRFEEGSDEEMPGKKK